MSKLDRYVFISLLGPFAFFAMVFAGILWLLQSLRLVDTVISSGQSALIFLEFSMLVVPNVMIFVLPLATFAASLFTINRLYVESELVVMFMSGQSPWSLVRPFLIFSGLIALAMVVLCQYLYPLSVTKLADRLSEVRTEFANSLIVEGQFRHPSPGVTFYIRDTNTQGEMAGIFVHDARNAANPVTYSANRAVLVGDTDSAQIVMFDGVAQHLNRVDETYSTVNFTRFAYDVSSFLADGSTRNKHPREYFVTEGLSPSEDMLASAEYGQYISEAHDKLRLPVLTLVLPLIALGGILMGSFRRGGFGLRMGISVGLVVLIQVFLILTKTRVRAEPQDWWVAYFPVILTVILGCAMIAYSTRMRRRAT